jgi:ribosomal protein L7/L12
MQNDMLYIAAPLLVATLYILDRLFARLRSIEAKLNRLLELQSIDANALPEPSAEVLALVQSNEKIAAIKAYRQQTGAGLKDAKDVVEKCAQMQQV